ncbi:toxin-antitoxin system YwqK family antitoxin [Verrucomicrobia bacterium]|nr:toxin-antitoxin system YwqK family antitoxin [Verrucomicrobiota bacterium]
MKSLLLIAVTILAVGCGGKDESTTETKPVEEKVQEVKEEGKPEEPLVETKPELEGVNQDELDRRADKGVNQDELDRNGENPNFTYFIKGSDTPYTGKVFELYENGQKMSEFLFKDGKRDGLSIGWYDNGQKGLEANYKDGKLDGLFTEWYENGQKTAEANFKDGKRNGLIVLWHENGQKQLEANFNDDEVVKGSAKFWNSKGEPVDSEEEANK